MLRHLWKRRTVVTYGAGVMAAQATLPSTAKGATFQRSISGTSRLHDVQLPLRRVVVTESQIVALFENIARARFEISGSSLSGEHLWQYVLPIARYGGISTARGARTILLHALGYTTSDRKYDACLLGLDTANGSLAVVDDLSGRMNTRLTCANDSFFISANRDGVQLLGVNDNLRLEPKGPLHGIDASYVHAEPASRDTVSILDQEGRSLHTISLPNGQLMQKVIAASQEFDIARQHAQTLRAKTQMSEDVKIPILAATGSDHLGSVYCLVLPIIVGTAAPIVSITTVGIVSVLGTFVLPPFGGDLGSAVKIVKTGSSLGLVYSSGSINWYTI